MILKYEDKWNKLAERVRFAGSRIALEDIDDEPNKKGMTYNLT